MSKFTSKLYVSLSLNKSMKNSWFHELDFDLLSVSMSTQLYSMLQQLPIPKSNEKQKQNLQSIANAHYFKAKRFNGDARTHLQ